MALKDLLEPGIWLDFFAVGLWRCLFISETQASFQGWILEQANRSDCRAAEEIEGKVMNEDSIYGKRRNGTDSTESKWRNRFKGNNRISILVVSKAALTRRAPQLQRCSSADSTLIGSCGV